MSSDYIPRLRRELVSAAARKHARFRWARAARGLRPLAAAAAVALAAVAIVVALDRPGDETPAELPAGSLRLGYRVDGPAGATAEAADVMRTRLVRAGIGGASVSVESGGRLVITAPAGERRDVAALTQPGALAIYDWERSVLGPGGAPAPADPRVTGGASAGQAGAVTRAEAEARAAQRPGAVVVRAEAAASNGWFALGGDPALTATDVAGAGAALDRLNNEPIVTIQFTERGQTAFEALTRRLAERGQARNANAVAAPEGFQHLALVIDDRIAAVPFIDFREAPDGIDGSGGTQIQGGLTADSARRMAAILSSGPLPEKLVPENQR